MGDKSHSNPGTALVRMPRFSCLVLFGRRQPRPGNGLDPKTCEADHNAPLDIGVSGCFAELTMLWFGGSSLFKRPNHIRSWVTPWGGKILLASRERCD